MVKMPATKPKHVPQRTCVICRETLPKRSLIRVVRTPPTAIAAATGTAVSAGPHPTTVGPVQLAVDARGKIAGRGAYLCPRRECFTSSRARSAVARALALEISEQDWVVLARELEKLAAERGPAPKQGATATKQPS
jgi:predicted RNA-binding protein YlxR (DUF448 family)